MLRLEGTIKRYIGLASDVKPRPATGANIDREHEIPPGSSFLESDTGLIYRWDGFEWRAPAADDLAAILRSIDARLAQLVELTANL